MSEKKTQKRASARRTSGLDERTRTRIAYAVFALLVIVFFRAVLLEGKAFVSSDALAPAGFAHVGTEELAQGRYPLWNPYNFAGMPSFGSLLFNPNVFWPDVLLGAVTRVLHLPVDTWLVLYYFLLGAGLLAFLRREGVAPEAALVGAVALTFTPNLIAVGAHGHGSQLVASSLIPLALLLVASLFRRPSVGATGGLALVLGLSLLRGHVQISYYTLVMVGVFTLVELVMCARAPSELPRIGRALAGVLVALGLAGAMSAVLFLPVRDYAVHSIRSAAAGGGVAFDYATGWSLGLREVWTFFVPSAVGFGGATYWGGMPFTDYPNYMGLGVFVLALLGFVFARRLRAFCGVVMLAALLVAMGKNTPVYQLLYDHLPYFNKFRVPVMVLVLLQVAVASLCALMLGRVSDAAHAGDAERASLAKPLLVGGIALGAIGVLFPLLRSAFEGGYLAAATSGVIARGQTPEVAGQVARAAWSLVVADVPRVALLAAVMLVASSVFVRGVLPRAVWMIVLVLCVMIDLWTIDAKVLRPVIGRPSDRTAILQRDDVIDFLAQDSTLFRVLPLDPRDFGDNRYAAFRIASVGGYHAAKPALFDTFLNTTQLNDLRHLDMLNVKYLIAPANQPRIENPSLELAFTGSRQVYVNRLALPRAWAVDRARIVANGDSALAAIRRPEFDPAVEAILQQDDLGATQLPTMSAAGANVRVTQYGLNELTIDATLDAPCLVMLGDAYYPDWVAYVDGRKTPVHKANYLLRAVLVPAGHHTIRMAYESQAIRTGLRGTIAGSVGALLLVLVPLARGILTRRSRAT